MGSKAETVIEIEGHVAPNNADHDRALEMALRVCQEVAYGNFEARIINIEEDGKLGELMHSINLLIDRTDAYLRESQACLEYVSRNQYYRHICETGMVGSFLDAARIINSATDFIQEKNDGFKQIATKFEGQMGAVVESVSSSVNQLKSVSEATSNSSARAQQQSTVVAANAEQASASMVTIASSTEQLMGSINEINRQVKQSSEFAEKAVDKSRIMTDQIDKLASASKKIEEINKLIRDVAFQTNLLAFNATIEAARAGQAGRSFSIVADEVKRLADQTSEATSEVETQIEDIQSVIKNSVSSNREISETITEVNSISSAIAVSVQEQNEATKEIARSIDEVAQGTLEVSAKISDVSEATTEVQNMSTQVLSASTELMQQEKVLDYLRSEMIDFLQEVKKVG